jgi:hypothetical protein
MTVARLEGLLDAIASLKGWNNPDSEAYSLRNPLMIQSFSRPGKNEITDSGVRVFASSLAGIRACLFDLGIKVRGGSRAGLKKEDRLENLLRVLGVDQKLGQQQVVKFLKRALKTDDISITTPLSWFADEEKK